MCPNRGAARRHPVLAAAPAGARPADPARPARRCAADPARQPAGRDRLAGQALALAAALASGAQVPRLVQPQAKGDGPVSCCSPTAPKPGRCAATRGPSRAARRLLASDAAPTAAAFARRRVPRIHRGSGAGNRALPGHRRDRGRHAGRHGAALFRDQRTDALHLRLACGATPEGWRASALVLERVAGAGGVDPALNEAAQEESWRTATMLAATVTDAELLDETCRPSGCCTGCSTARASRPTGRGRSPMGAAARASGWSAFWRVSDRRPRPDGDRRGDRHDLRVLQLRFRFAREEVRGRHAGAAGVMD